MIVAMYLLVLLSFAFGLTSPNDEFNYDKFTPNNVYVEPVEGAPKYAGPRIIGGVEVAPNSVPYQVAVIVNSNSLCGGSLITSSAVLTAAHCTISAAFAQILLGAHNITQAESGRVNLTSSSIHNHPSYNEANVGNDIAIVLLPSQVTLTNAIQLVSLAPASAGTYAGQDAFLSGWGKTSDASTSISPVLRGVNLNIISNSICQSIFGSYVQASNICTSGTGAIGPCTSDSGSPLVVDSVQVGVVSFGPLRCEGGDPTAYARVSFYRPWISTIAGV